MTGADEKNKNAVFCRGESMLPIFRPGDRVRFVPCRIEEVRQGDVIIFSAPGQEERIIHRVVSTGPGSIRTQGDANPCRDAWGLKQEDIVGRAVSVERGGRIIPVAGGRAGHCAARGLGLLRRMDHWSSWVLHPLYRVLSQSGVMRRLASSFLSPRVVIIRRQDGTEKQLILGKRLIGRLTPGAAEWRIRRPFRLFVDERTLDP